MDWLQYWMLFACIRALKVVILKLDLFGHLVTAHFCRPTSMPDHVQNLSILFNWSWSDWSLSARAATSSAKVAIFIVVMDVPNV